MTADQNDDWVSKLRQTPPDPEAHKLFIEKLRLGMRAGLRKKSQVTESDLEDWLQEAQLKIFDKIDTFRGESRFMTWAVAIGIRVGLSALRRRKDLNIDYQKLVQISGSASIESQPVWQAEQRELLQRLAYFVENVLSDEQKLVINSLLAGVSTSTIAEILGSNSNAIYKKYHDARLKLRRAFEAEGFSGTEIKQHLQRGRSQL